MVTIARRPSDEQVPPTREERAAQPGLEGLRQVLRVVIFASLAAALLLAAIPVFGTLGLLVAGVAVLAYVGLMIVSRLEHRRYMGRRGEVGEPREVGLRVVTGGQPTGAVDTGDATVDHEARLAAPEVLEAPAVARAPGDGQIFSPAQRAGLKVLARIAVVVVVLAVIVAATVFDQPYLGIGLLLAFALMTLFGFPVWLASAEDAAEAKKQAGLQRP